VIIITVIIVTVIIMIIMTVIIIIIIIIRFGRNETRVFRLRLHCLYHSAMATNLVACNGSRGNVAVVLVLMSLNVYQPHQSCLDSPPHSFVSSSLPLSSSITLSLQAQNLPFRQILPTLDFFYLPDCLRDIGTGLDLSRSTVYF